MAWNQNGLEGLVAASVFTFVGVGCYKEKKSQETATTPGTKSSNLNQIK